MWRSEIARTAITANYQRYVWFVAWPLIMLALVGSCAGQSKSVGGQDTRLRDEVTRYGAGAILSYITATPADGGQLAAIYGDLVDPPAGQQGIPLPRQIVLGSFASATQHEGSDDWQVELTANTPSGLVHWQVPVRVFPSGYRVVALPGMVPGLPAGPSVSVNAAAPIDPKSDAPVAVTVRDFLAAWLTGTGDLGRVADLEAVAAFSRPPFSRVTLMQAWADEQIPTTPEGQLSVGVVVWGMNTQTTQLSYHLRLTASAGRWVVSDVAATPSVREDTSTDTALAGP